MVDSFSLWFAVYTENILIEWKNWFCSFHRNPDSKKLQNCSIFLLLLIVKLNFLKNYGIDFFHQDFNQEISTCGRLRLQTLLIVSILWNPDIWRKQVLILLKTLDIQIHLSSTLPALLSLQISHKTEFY